jgi:hypothetical protein
MKFWGLTGMAALALQHRIWRSCPLKDLLAFQQHVPVTGIEEIRRFAS